MQALQSYLSEIGINLEVVQVDLGHETLLFSD